MMVISSAHWFFFVCWWNCRVGFYGTARLMSVWSTVGPFFWFLWVCFGKWQNTLNCIVPPTPPQPSLPPPPAPSKNILKNDISNMIYYMCIVSPPPPPPPPPNHFAHLLQIACSDFCDRDTRRAPVVSVMAVMSSESAAFFFSRNRSVLDL